MKKDFVTAINNANKMYPPLFLTPVEHELQGRKILHIYVPVGTQEADVLVGYMIEIMNPILILQIMKNLCINYMQESRELIL